MDKKQLEEKLTTKTIIARILLCMFIFESMVIMFGVALVNDKTNMILELQDEKQECLDGMEELLQKNVTMDKKLREYKRVYGDIDE